MSTLRLLGNTLVIAPIRQAEPVNGVITPIGHYEASPQQWKVLQVGPGRLSKNGERINCGIQPGDTVITPKQFDALHEFTDGVRIVDAGVVVGKVE